MSDRIAWRGTFGENNLFIMALTLSMLVHLAALLWGRDQAASVGERGAMRDHVAFEVGLLPSQALARETLAHKSSGHTANRSRVHRTTAAVMGMAQGQVSPVPNDATTAETQGGETSGGTVVSVQGDETVDEDSVEHYLAAILARIESHKFYPQMARRREVQGKVEVRFMLDAQGGIFAIAVNGNSALLEEAAQSALRNALPLPPAPTAEGFPRQVSYQMIFKLQ